MRRDDGNGVRERADGGSAAMTAGGRAGEASRWPSAAPATSDLCFVCLCVVFVLWFVQRSIGIKAD